MRLAHSSRPPASAVGDLHYGGRGNAICCQKLPLFVDFDSFTFDNPRKGGFDDVPESLVCNPRDIHLLTTDALLADLVGGRAVATGAGSLLTIESEDARAILDWYRSNPTKWAANLNAGDTDAIIDLIGSPPPESTEVLDDAPAGERKVLRLIKVEAHRFAGLHLFGRTTEAPDRFVFAPGKDVTLFEGANGSGKTSIVNAIVWCLTGHLLRSQRAPEAGPVEFPCEVTQPDGSVTEHPMSAITPMPHAESDVPEAGKPILADTWVELTFADNDGIVLPPIRRTQSRKPTGKIVEDEPNFAAMGVDPIAWRIATTMPALLPFLAVGSGLVTVLRRSPERLELAQGDRRDDQAFR